MYTNLRTGKTETLSLYRGKSVPERFRIRTVRFLFSFLLALFLPTTSDDQGLVYFRNFVCYNFTMSHSGYVTSVHLDSLNLLANKPIYNLGLHEVLFTAVLPCKAI